MARVTIVGAHGKVAIFLGERLAKAGHEVKGLVRKSEQFSDLEAIGVNPVLFDLEDSELEDYGKVFQGSDAVVFAAGSGGGDVDRTFAIDRDSAIKSMDAAVKIGVGRFVIISSVAAGHPEKSEELSDYLKAKGEADDHLEAIPDLDWTIVRPGPLSNDSGTEKIQIGESRDSVDGSPIPRADVAAVLEAVLSSPNTIRKVFTVFGGSTPVAEAVAAI